MQMKDKRHPLCAKGCMCQSSPPKLPQFYLPSQPLTLRLVIISFRPAWLARALLSFKRAQSSGND